MHVHRQARCIHHNLQLCASGWTCSHLMHAGQTQSCSKAVCNSVEQPGSDCSCSHKSMYLMLAEQSADALITTFICGCQSTAVTGRLCEPASSQMRPPSPALCSTGTWPLRDVRMKASAAALPAKAWRPLGCLLLQKSLASNSLVGPCRCSEPMSIRMSDSMRTTRLSSYLNGGDALWNHAANS